MAMTAGRLIRLVLLALVILLVAAQFIPVERSNPATDPAQSLEATARPPAAVSATLERSCRDCHSNRTTWPWYSRVAPASWLVASDVKEGRSHLNFSEWGRLDNRRAAVRLEEICEEIRSGAMPDWKYVLLHPQAKLSQQEIDAICSWANAARTALEQPAR